MRIEEQQSTADAKIEICILGHSNRVPSPSVLAWTAQRCSWSHLSPCNFGCDLSFRRNSSERRSDSPVPRVAHAESKRTRRDASDAKSYFIFSV